MNLQGTLDLNIYKCISENICTDSVIITKERMEHISQNHADQYENIISHIMPALQDPDYILSDKHPNTGIVLKKFQNENTNFQIVLRVQTSTNSTHFSNSVISAWRIRESEFQRIIRKKEVLYKKN